MTTAIQNFSPQLFNNCYGLENYLRAEPTLAKIAALAKDPKFVKAPTSTPYFNRWQVFLITIKYPFNTLFASLFTCVSFVLNLLYLQKMSRIFGVLSKHMIRDWEQVTDQWQFQTPMLVPAFNHHEWTSWDVYQNGSIPTNFIQDEVVEHLTFQSNESKAGMKKAMKTFYKHLEKERAQLSWHQRILRRATISQREKDQTTQAVTKLFRENPNSALTFLTQKYARDPIARPISHFYDVLRQTDINVKSLNSVKLYSESGVCRGASTWFIYLYLKTLVHFDDPEKHLIAVAELFKAGIPGPAALIHALKKTKEILQLKKQNLKNHRVSLHELDHNPQSAKQKINSLPTGVYRVGVYHHSFVYIKISETRGYVWNPSWGLFPMTGDEMSEMIFKHHYKPSDLHSYIYFHEYRNLDGSNPTKGS